MRIYSAYKNSGEDWLGEVPQHWERKTIRSLAKVVSERGRSDLPLLSVYRDFGVTLRRADDENHNVIPEDLSNYKVVRPGNLVMNKMKTWQGSLGVSDYEGIVSPAYIVCKLLGDNNPKYIHRLLRSKCYIFAWKRISYGVRVDQWDMRFADFKQVPVFLPPRKEQDAIVAFLETKEAEIQKFIANKRRMIELLKEQKVAIINRAVTRGLDPNAPLKSSGVDWLGDVPAHWKIFPLKRLCKMNVANLPETTPPDFEFEYIDIGSVEENGIATSLEKMRFENSPSRARRKVKYGDTIISTVRTYLKAIAFIEERTRNLIVSTGFAVLTPRNECEPKFLSFAVKADYFISNVTANSIGVSYPAISEYKLGWLKLALPPTSEQKQIVEHIEEKSKEINGAISVCEREIALIEEYRAALVDAAVTGKIDVRQPEKAKAATVQPQAAVYIWTPRKQFFGRTLIAAEITSRFHHKSDFGHILLTKSLYTTKHHAKLNNFPSNFTRQDHGPYDNSLIKSVENQMSGNKWFEIEGRKGEQWHYKTSDKFGGHRKYLEDYWGEQLPAIENVLKIMNKLNYRQAEIVATIYAAWNDFLIYGKEPSDDLIVYEVLNNWHEKKKLIEEVKWRAALQWMKDENFVPSGFGEPTLKKK